MSTKNIFKTIKFCKTFTVKNDGQILYRISMNDNDNDQFVLRITVMFHIEGDFMEFSTSSEYSSFELIELDRIDQECAELTHQILVEKAKVMLN